VQNDYIVTVYGQGYGFAPPTSLLKTLAPQYPIYGIALDNGTFVYGANQAVQFSSETQVLVNGNYSSTYTPTGTGFATTGDKYGNFYVGDLSAVRYSTAQGDASSCNCATRPSGIAVDNYYGRVYFSNSNANTIDVYSTSRTHLYTIHYTISNEPFSFLRSGASVARPTDNF
jgi:hypothetical protein